ncbi:LOW QUALITY PROTEIN: NB-ARC domain containing protein [Parasponia andersonii]|uniref:NB-ARC domain containing protein n=1 Tax=Parasponia andersonii TaxID=3476 RepID=A0A2P5BGL9_PARAD|nr:LOW QUALITY PROTEIN: NB-ARC domain containing protein [Parasponia andersonii]
MSCRIREIKKKLDDFAADHSNFQLDVRREKLHVVARGVREETYSFVREEQVIGREKDRLTNLKRMFRLFPGMVGLGKMTLAQLIFNDEKVQNHFELKIWVCVSDAFEMKKVLQQIINSADHKSPGDLQMDQKQKQLRSILDGERYLLVLDDVWNEDREKWLRLNDLLLSGKEGSRNMVTTRSKMVAEIIRTRAKAYHLGILDEDDVRFMP